MAEFGSPSYSFEELVAELGSCYLCSHAGISQKELRNSAAYIQGWLSQLKSNYTYIVLASSQAQRAVNYILNKQEDCPVLEKASNHRA
jgi:antirestriction protein ArdC